MAKRAESEITIAGVRLTHLGKVLYPEQGITKQDLAQYYLAVAKRMLPHVARRPISLVRCPVGRQQRCFFQRHASEGMPRSVKEIAIPGFEDSGAYLYIEDERGLISLVQMGVLEIHPWGAPISDPGHPDRVIFDLDPGEGVRFAEVVATARLLRAKLHQLDLDSFVKTTGGKGLHVVLPIARRHGWAEVKAWARAFAVAIAAASPERYLTRVAKAERRGRIFIDYLRNDPTSTAVAPYSTRSREGAPVATPLAWEELTPVLDPAAFTIATVPKRLAHDPWAAMTRLRQRLPVARAPAAPPPKRQRRAMSLAERR